MTRITLILLFFALFSSCRKDFLGSDMADNPRNNFEYVWKTMDTKYSFFNYKHVNWDSVYTVYSPLIYNQMSNQDLFNTLGQMLNVLHDGHVNLTSSFSTSSYESVFKNSPENFNNHLISDFYLGGNYYTTGGFQHQIIANGQIGYIRYASFTSAASGSDMDFIVNRFKNLKGIIIDVRNNSGGYVNNLFNICNHFIDTTYLVYISYLKNGPGHNDYSGPDAVYISPASVHFTKKVCVLTNRGCYSATSFLVLAMRNFPNVTIVGDTTGGGLGAPSGAELPNGWALRYSSSVTLSPHGKNYENGIPPDVEVNMLAKDERKGFDTIIERAISIILSN